MDDILREPSHWDCSICLNVLLEPVVGRCGHDFCKKCLASLALHTLREKILCPLCRSELASKEDIQKLGVCFRLKHLVESLYPERVAKRRQEAAVADAASAQVAATQAPAPLQRNRPHIRARRTRLPAPHLPEPAVSAASTGPLLPHAAEPAFGPALHAAGHLSSPPLPPSAASLAQLLAHALPAAGIALLGEPATATAATVAHGFSHAGEAGGPARSSSVGLQGEWVTPPEVGFVMGWYEPASCRSRRRGRGGRDGRGLTRAY
ncbi:hypothetical protein V8C86DRAFT_2712529 [Haematococcus lacustris]